jgi:hypothetical protein
MVIGFSVLSQASAPVKSGAGVAAALSVESALVAARLGAKGMLATAVASKMPKRKFDFIGPAV